MNAEFGFNPQLKNIDPQKKPRSFFKTMQY